MTNSIMEMNKTGNEFELKKREMDHSNNVKIYEKTEQSYELGSPKVQYLNKLDLKSNPFSKNLSIKSSIADLKKNEKSNLILKGTKPHLIIK